VLVTVVEDAVEVELLDLGDRSDVPRPDLMDLDVVLAVKLEEVPDSQRFLVVVQETGPPCAAPPPSERGSRRAFRRTGPRSL